MSNNLVQTNIQTEDKGRHKYDHVYNRLDSIMKRILHNALNKKMYTLGYGVMNYSNLSPKMLVVLDGQIKTKTVYSFLLKKFTVGMKIPILLSDSKLNDIYHNYYSNPENEDQINEETKKLVQILLDHFPIIIQITQILFA